MKLIIGLGNPGNEYAHTRHNAGFMALDHFVEKNSFHANWRENSRAHAYTLSAKLNGHDIMLVKPQTYMNNSGQAIASLLGEHKLSAQDIIVMYDDFDLDLGTIRVRNSGSAGTHNGMKSIISILKTEDFIRIRLGIGNRNDTYFVDKKIPRDEYVLMPFLQLELKTVEEMLSKASDYLKLLITNGYQEFISKHNEG